MGERKPEGAALPATGRDAREDCRRTWGKRGREDLAQCGCKLCRQALDPIDTPGVHHADTAPPCSSCPGDGLGWMATPCEECTPEGRQYAALERIAGLLGLDMVRVTASEIADAVEQALPVEVTCG